MDVQQVLLIAAIAAFAVSVIFAVLAIRTFVMQNIRGVMDDLSGRARQQGIAASLSGERGSRPARIARTSKSNAISGAPADAVAPNISEDAIETRVNTLLTRMPAPKGLTVSAADVTPTMVVHADADQVHVAFDTDLVDGTVTNSPQEMVEHQAPIAFVVTRRTVCLHADGVIAAG